MNLDGKTALLTGAGGGIGTEMALALAAAGATLILVARNEARLALLRDRLHGEGHMIVVADLTQQDGRRAVVEVCGTGLDLLVNNAGVNHFGMFEQQSEALIRQMLEVNVFVPMILTQALLPLLRARAGTIVNVGSGFGSIGFPGYCGYSASKFALRGFSEALGRELADSQVSVQYLGPRAVATDMNPPEVVAMNEELGNDMDSPQEVARELMVLLESGNRSRLMGRTERFFARLNSVFPGLVDSALGKKLPVIRRQAMAAQVQSG
ncbi:MAG: SDR family oxidoreductase [Halioglobus sp.]